MITTVGPAIRMGRKAAGVTQASLAFAVGVSRPFVSQVESGRKMPSLRLVIDIAYALDMTPGELLGEIWVGE